MDAVAPLGRDATGATVVLGVNLDDLGDHRPGQRAAAERGRGVPARRRRASPRPTCARRRATSGCARGTSRPPPAWRRGCPTARRSRSACSRAVERAERGAARAGLRRPAGPPLRRPGPPRGARSTTSTAVRRPARRGRGGGAGRRLPLRHPRPRRAALGQPQRRAAHPVKSRAHASSVTRVHVGKVRCAAPSRSTMRPFRSSSRQARA